MQFSIAESIPPNTRKNLRIFRRGKSFFYTSIIVVIGLSMIVSGCGIDDDHQKNGRLQDKQNELSVLQKSRSAIESNIAKAKAEQGIIRNALWDTDEVNFLEKEVEKIDKSISSV